MGAHGERHDPGAELTYTWGLLGRVLGLGRCFGCKHAHDALLLLCRALGSPGPVAIDGAGAIGVPLPRGALRGRRRSGGLGRRPGHGGGAVDGTEPVGWREGGKNPISLLRCGCSPRLPPPAGSSGPALSCYGKRSN